MRESDYESNSSSEDDPTYVPDSSDSDKKIFITPTQ